MKRVNQILNDTIFIKCSNMNKKLEINRKYCRHGIEHSLDVARILYIYTLENNIKIKKDIIYVTALLHDIGRYAQYEANLSHHKVSADIAKEMLEKYDFSDEEINAIYEAILSHNTYEEDENMLKMLLYKADKISRNCFSCDVSDECYWDETIKNTDISY